MNLCKYVAGSGSLNMWCSNNILYGQFKGPVGKGMLEQFDQSLKVAVKLIGDQPWGYISVSPDAHATTPDAFKMMVSQARRMIDYGCVTSAYILNSVIAVDQIRQMRRELGLDENVEEIRFTSLVDAEAYINESLALFKERQQVT